MRYDDSLTGLAMRRLSTSSALVIRLPTRQLSLIQSRRRRSYDSVCCNMTNRATNRPLVVTTVRQISSDSPKPAKQPCNNKAGAKSDADDDGKEGAVHLPTTTEDHEKVLTIPNALTMARIISSPYIGYLIVQQEYGLALAGCVVFGLTDALDGYIARKYNMRSFVGSIIDPAADKVLMTTLTLSLTYSGLMPTVLAAVIIGRDVALSFAAFFIRWATLPPPKTVARYFDLSIPSVEVRPTRISKWNTALQLLLMGATLTSPVFGISADCIGLVGLQWLTGTTTVASGIGYLTSKDAVHRLTKSEVAKRIPKPHNILHKKK
ncbi:hypothetical protein IWW48_002452 [Coemansia sp. RSA 1200]|nr:hypothetical protein IWW48_002452 [Coemansia sp. RSA 1200]